MEDDKKRYRDNLQGEIDGAYLYEALAKSEPDPKLAEVYKRLAGVERRHAKVWADELGVQAPAVLKPGWRTRVLGWLSKKLGTQAVLPTVVSLEQRDQGRYEGQPEGRAAGLPADEASHARLMEAVAGGRGFEGSAIARFVPSRQPVPQGMALPLGPSSRFAIRMVAVPRCDLQGGIRAGRSMAACSEMLPLRPQPR